MILVIYFSRDWGVGMAIPNVYSLKTEEIDRALERTEPGLRRYVTIQSRFRDTDVRTNPAFQRNYNAFYRVRRGETWRRAYYDLMERSKARGINFTDALDELLNRTGQLEASFASKLVATIDPHWPVIDQFVLSCCGLRLAPPYHGVTRRRDAAVVVYDQLVAWYRAVLDAPVGRMIRERFSARFPWASITEIKKVDLVLWQHRPGTTLAGPGMSAGGRE